MNTLIDCSRSDSGIITMYAGWMKRQKGEKKGWKEVNDQGKPEQPENRINRASQQRALSGSLLCILQLRREFPIANDPEK